MVYHAPDTPLPGDVLSGAFWDVNVRDRILQTLEALATASGQELVSTGANAVAAAWNRKVKTADETVNTGALQDDDHLAWTVTAGERWAFRAVLHVVGASAISTTFAFAIPASSSGVLVAQHSNSNIGAGYGAGMIGGSFAMGAANTFAIGATTSGNILIVEGFFNCGTTGTVQLQWHTGAGGNVTLKTGSYLDLKRLA